MRYITDEVWGRMSWHQRQRYLVAQTRKLRSIREQIDAEQLHERAEAANPHTATPQNVINEARRLLAELTPDPNAAQHRADLLAAITPRKDTA